MTKQRKIVDAKNAPDKTISHVMLEGNTTWTPVETAMRMADRGDRQRSFGPSVECQAAFAD